MTYGFHWVSRVVPGALMLVVAMSPMCVSAQTPSNHAEVVHSVPVIKLEPSGGDLRVQLKREVDSATAHGQTVLVDLGAPWCGQCQQFEHTFSDSVMVSALSSARLVHLDFDTWYSQLVAGGYVAAYDLPELFLLTPDGGKGASFDRAATWDVYSDSLSQADSVKNSGGKHRRDAEFMAPPLQAFLESARHPLTAGNATASRP